MNWNISTCDFYLVLYLILKLKQKYVHKQNSRDFIMTSNEII
jgi:hypothetical protein